MSFPAPPQAVVFAARRFADQALAGWAVQATAEGFDASGESAFHHAVAHFRFVAIPNGTKVDVELLVERASAVGGFMLVDIGGYYDSQLWKWLWAIGQELNNLHTDPHARASVEPSGAAQPKVTVDARVAVIDATGKTYLGVVRQVTPVGVLVAYDEGGERWVPPAAAHVVVPRDSF
jgi:hypothetical protein